MRRVETVSSGESVVTRTVHILESDCVLLVQEINDAKGNVEIRNTITLSRDDINTLCDEYATDKKKVITDVKTLRAYTDKKARRHYYPEHEEWQLMEHTGDNIKLDMTGQAEILISREEADALAKLFKHFAKNGTLPIPLKQKPSKVCT